MSDLGPGIPPGTETRIFRAFERLGSRTDDGVTGTGLGLTIAQDLAERMGGTLSAQSRDKGARFILTLPSAPENVVSMPRLAAS